MHTTRKISRIVIAVGWNWKVDWVIRYTRCLQTSSARCVVASRWEVYQVACGRWSSPTTVYWTSCWVQTCSVVNSTRLFAATRPAASINETTSCCSTWRSPTANQTNWSTPYDRPIRHTSLTSYDITQARHRDGWYRYLGLLCFRDVGRGW